MWLKSLSVGEIFGLTWQAALAYLRAGGQSVQRYKYAATPRIYCILCCYFDSKIIQTSIRPRRTPLLYCHQ